jgi:hypothetical protein
VLGARAPLDEAPNACVGYVAGEAVNRLPPLLDELRDARERKFRQRAVEVRAALHLSNETFILVATCA